MSTGTEAAWRPRLGKGAGEPWVGVLQGLPLVVEGKWGLEAVASAPSHSNYGDGTGNGPGAGQWLLGATQDSSGSGGV